MSNKPYIHKRIIAYFVDILIISIISTIISIPFSKSEDYQKVSKELHEITDKYKKEEINENEYLDMYENINYKLTKLSVNETIIIVVVSSLYFVLFNYYNNGQTLGKKLMKLRIVSSDNEKLSINNYVIRSLVVNTTLSNLITVVLILTLSKEKYLIYDSKFSAVFGLLYIICFCFILYRSDGKGLHDLLASTIVANEKDIINENNEIKDAEIVIKKDKKKRDKEVK